MDKNEQAAATADIFYEALMLHRAYEEYWKGEPDTPHTWVRNSILEATLIHTRALMDFFESTRKPGFEERGAKKYDVISEDYGFAHSEFPFAESLRRRINARIAHLSYVRTRVSDEERLWRWDDFIPLMLSRCREFFAHLLASGGPFSDFASEARLKQFVSGNVESSFPPFAQSAAAGETRGMWSSTDSL